VTSNPAGMRRWTIAGLVVAAFTIGAVAAAVIDRGAPKEPPSATPVPQAPPVKQPRRKRGPLPTVRIAAVGDITLGRTPSLPDGGAFALLRGARSALRGGVVLGNLETTLATGGPAKCAPGAVSCFSFRAPPGYALALRRLGFTVLNLANNHAYDYGAVGQKETVRALRRARLADTGRPGEITYRRVGRVRVALVGFAPYDWAQSLLDLAAARRLVRKADRHADVVVATMHAGAEGVDHAHVEPGPESYLGEQRGNVVAFAHAAVNAGADVVIGHGPHVLRGLEWYHGHLIAYSLGNFSSYRTLAVGGVLGVSMVLQVTLRADGRFVRGRIVALRLVGVGAPTVDRDRAAVARVRSLSKDDFGRRAMRVTARGLLLPPKARRPSPGSGTTRTPVRPTGRSA
jgi:Bacterial capsule synthesis protein PGA_cap